MSHQNCKYMYIVYMSIVLYTTFISFAVVHMKREYWNSNVGLLSHRHHTLQNTQDIVSMIKRVKTFRLARVDGNPYALLIHVYGICPLYYMSSFLLLWACL